jgi:hypothetical protein
MYFLYKYEYGTLKPVEITLKREMGRRENNGGDEPNQGIIHVYIEMPQQTVIY